MSLGLHLKRGKEGASLLNCGWGLVGVCGIEDDDDDDEEEETNTSKKPSERASQRNDDVRWRRSLGA